MQLVQGEVGWPGFSQGSLPTGSPNSLMLAQALVLPLQPRPGPGSGTSLAAPDCHTFNFVRQGETAQLHNVMPARAADPLGTSRELLDGTHYEHKWAAWRNQCTACTKINVQHARKSMYSCVYALPR